MHCSGLSVRSCSGFLCTGIFFDIITVNGKDMKMGAVGEKSQTRLKRKKKNQKKAERYTGASPDECFSERETYLCTDH